MKKYFYNLSFSYKIRLENKETDSDTFNIGYFSSKDKAQKIIEELKNKPGFCKYPVNCFILRKRAVDFSRNICSKDGLVLYVLTHEYMLNDKDYSVIWTDFGMFENEESAICMLNKQKCKYPYKHYPEGFDISKWRVNRDVQWTEGFTNGDD